MKKFIATILSAIVGLFGYTIVDTAIDSRVADLENRVEYLESIVEEYHGEVNIPTTTRPAESITIPSGERLLFDSGYCGDHVTWEFYSDGELIIGGEGAMYETDPVWSHYCTGIKKVVIKDGVTSISRNSFFNCSNLTSITIPDSVTSIGTFAFYGCTNLKAVTIGANVTEIGNMAFAGCDNLTDVYYAGTEAQWNAITIGASNARLTDATIHYNA